MSTVFPRKRGPALRNLSRAPFTDPETRQQRRLAERQQAKLERSAAALTARKAKVAARKRGRVQ